MNKFYLLSDALDYIEAHLTGETSPQEIADACYCSLSTLQKLFRYTFHIGVSDYVSRRRLTCCARELIRTDHSVLQIALDWGYNSPEVFTRAFTRLWGETPAAFRKTRRFTGIFPKFEMIQESSGGKKMTTIHKKYVIDELYDYLSAHKNAYLIAFDIKGLMPINDISVKAGDIAIREALRRIEEAAEEDMLLFRIGGDEFVLATGTENEADVSAVIGRVLAKNGQPIEWEGKSIPLSLYATPFRSENKTIRYGELFSQIAQALEDVKGK